MSDYLDQNSIGHGARPGIVRIVRCEKREVEVAPMKIDLPGDTVIFGGGVFL